MRSSGPPAWGVNGRFLFQNATGVQRYATEVVRHLGDASTRAGIPAPCLIVPPTEGPRPVDGDLAVRSFGWGRGHVWEQMALPFASPGCVLNLCNMGPVALTEQIVCIHDVNVFHHPGSYTAAFGRFYRLMLPVIGRRSRFLATVSEYSADQIVSLGIAPARKVVVAPNSFEHVRRWKPERSAVGARLRSGRPFGLFVGTRARHKNVALVEAVAPALDELGVDVVLCGSRPAVFRPTGDRRQTSVIDLGQVSDDDLAWLYANALCLLFPSFEEGFGLPLVEAMAFGCPVVSSSVSAMPKVVKGAAVLADPTDPAAWVDAVRRILTSPSLVEDLAGAAGDVLAGYSWRKSADTYAELAARVIGGTGGS